MEYIPDGEKQSKNMIADTEPQNTNDTTFQPEISNQTNKIIATASDTNSNQENEFPDELKEVFENQESHGSITDMLDDATAAIDGSSLLGNIAMPDKKKKATNEKRLTWETNEFSFCKTPCGLLPDVLY